MTFGRNAHRLLYRENDDFSTFENFGLAQIEVLHLISFKKKLECFMGRMRRTRVGSDETPTKNWIVNFIYFLAAFPKLMMSFTAYVCIPPEGLCGVLGASMGHGGPHRASGELKEPKRVSGA